MLLTIITINLNNAAGLKKTIESVKGQTWKNYEYVVIDGGSVDESIGLIKDNSSSISHWISEADKGIYNAINKGIHLAKGKYLLILNSGDILNSPRVLETLSGYLEKNYDIVYGNTELVSPKAKPRIKTPPKKFYFDYLTHNTLVHQSVLIKRDLHHTVGAYNEELKIVADWAFLLDATAKYRATCLYVDLIISSYDTTGISAKNKNQRLKEQKGYLLKNYGFFLKKTHASFNEFTLREKAIFILKSLLPFALTNLILSKRHGLEQDEG